MSHPIARRAGMLALTAAMLMPSAGALSDVSSWAQEGVAAAQNAGLAPSSLSNSAASGSITRAEFCAVALNAYKAVSGKALCFGQKAVRGLLGPQCHRSLPARHCKRPHQRQL